MWKIDNINSERFLDAFYSIEKYLHNLANLDKQDSFTKCINKAKKSNKTVKKYENDLREFSDLRNAIVHERGGGSVIAEPNDWAVHQIERISSLFLDPPKVIPKFQKEVHSLQFNNPIAIAVKIMFNNSFSQIPIYRENQFIGLLTGETIARWLGSCADDDIFSLHDTYIYQALEFTEDRENYCFIERNAILTDLLDKWDVDRYSKRLEAVLITQNGKPDEKLLGIVTLWDIPAVLEIV